MKIESARYNNIWRNYAVTFGDGVTVILGEKFEYLNMISCGLDSYYMKKWKWPTTKNINARILLGITWIEKNKNRYKTPERKVAKNHVSD